MVKKGGVAPAVAMMGKSAMIHASANPKQTFGVVFLGILFLFLFLCLPSMCMSSSASFYFKNPISFGSEDDDN